MAIHLLLSMSLLLNSLSGAVSTTFTLTNSCGSMVWPGLLSSTGSPPLSTTGFPLAPGESRSVDAPAAWSGRIWGRTLCAAGQSSGRFSCTTGECGSGTVECAGGGAAPPATLAEFTLNGAGGNDFYDVSLVDGSNLPMVVVPQGGAGASCGATGCLVDLNGPCPSDLKVVGADGAGIACKSACGAYGRPEDCCSGAYGTPATCQPSASSQFFKNACPRAYSYAYDDATSTFTCSSGTANYLITFCPSISSLKSSVSSSSSSSSTNPSSGSGLPLVNDTVSFARRGGGYPYPYASAPRRASSSLPALAAAALTWLCLCSGWQRLRL
ncbi:thaumatin-like protein 1b [Phragmites australis]|uniref:thaumatin-like protein 1b n=1 Tax=Phragmites australis TaxID=29695 RepID=UPI002D78FB7D|nr:thaumatin-like protein 1b [Phragmites australis]